MVHTEKKTIYQWDINQNIIAPDARYIDYIDGEDVYRVEVVDGKCPIPDELLQKKGTLQCYACMSDYTIVGHSIHVHPREMPPDYVYTPTQKMSFDDFVERAEGKIDAYVEEAERATASAYEAANTASTEAANARGATSSARVAATQATNASNKADFAATLAEQYGAYAQNEAHYAEQATKRANDAAAEARQVGIDLNARAAAGEFNGRDGRDADVTAENIHRALGYDPADGAEVTELKSDLSALDDAKMERYVIRLVKNADGTYKMTSLDDADLTFEEVYNITRKLNEYVVVIYGSSKLRPQYVSTNEMMFIGIDRATDTKVLRVLYTPTRLTYETFALLENVKVGGTALPVSGGAVDVPIISGGGGRERRLGVPSCEQWGNSGIAADTDSTLYIVPSSNDNISNRRADYIGGYGDPQSHRPITPARLDYAVKAALTDGKGAAYTDAEKAVARERIGASGGKFELIDTVTVAEDTASILISSEPNGTPYNFVKFIVLCDLPPTSTAKYLVMSSNGQPEALSPYISPTANTQVFARFDLSVAEGVYDFSVSYSASANSNAAMQRRASYRLSPLVDGNMTRLRIYSSGGGTIAAGSVFTIYGIRA